MIGSRFRVLGLAHPRAVWFSEVGRWATTAALPIEFVKCVAVEELRSRLASGRAFSAIVIDGSLPGLDRDLVDLAHQVGAAVVLVDDGQARRDRASLGADGTLSDGFDRAALLAVLTERARPVVGPDTSLVTVTPAAPAGWRGRLVAVTGAPGSGRSTIAMALAQGLSDRARHESLVVLADLALDADQALLHDAGDVVPGLQELVEAHRAGDLSPDEIRSLTYRLESRRYHLLLGLRRHRDWVVLRPRPVHAALDGLLRTFRLVVADVDADVEGDDDVGSVEVEERNVLARTTFVLADLVLVVAPPTLPGLRRLLVAVDDLVRLGVPGDRLVPVITRAPRRTRARAEIAEALAALAGVAAHPLELASPVFVADTRTIDSLHHTATPLPRAMTESVTHAVEALLARGSVVPVAASSGTPVPVVPGSLGSWSHAAEAAG